MKHEAAYTDNKEFSIKHNGDLWLARLKAKNTVPGVDELTEMIRNRMPQRNILDIIVDTLKTLIGYYHVSDKYIALFSRFIPCGVYEAAFILDPFFPNKSDIKPHTVCGDTHAQSLTVFGLAYLLGIQLMPRIARWKNLNIYKFGEEFYSNIDPMFTSEEINEDLIVKHLTDMQRVSVSILED